jgi:hypothetical protein
MCFFDSDIARASDPWLSVRTWLILIHSPASLTWIPVRTLWLILIHSPASLASLYVVRLAVSGRILPEPLTGATPTQAWPVTSRPDVAHPHPLARVAHMTSCPDLVAHPHLLACIARTALCCAARSSRTDSARAAHWRRPRLSTCPLPVPMPPVTAALHPHVASTAEVRATDEHCTSDLCALRGIKLRAGVELHSSKQQGDIVLALKAHVARVRFNCFICFRGMLQVFHTDVAYVAMVVHVCCKLLFWMFHRFFRHMLQMCLSGCCVCFHTYDMIQVFFIWMLRMFTMVLSVLQVFLQVFQTHVSNILFVFRRMLQF